MPRDIDTSILKTSTSSVLLNVSDYRLLTRFNRRAGGLGLFFFSFLGWAPVLVLQLGTVLFYDEFYRWSLNCHKNDL